MPVCPDANPSSRPAVTIIVIHHHRSRLQFGRRGFLLIVDKRRCALARVVVIVWRMMLLGLLGTEQR
jgi:hypothetical protein